MAQQSAFAPAVRSIPGPGPGAVAHDVPRFAMELAISPNTPVGAARFDRSLNPLTGPSSGASSESDAAAAPGASCR